MAWGASFQDSLSARTEIPEPLRVWRWISVRRAALERKLNSCCKKYNDLVLLCGWMRREENYFVGVEIGFGVVLDFVVSPEFFEEDGVGVERCIRDDCYVL